MDSPADSEGLIRDGTDSGKCLDIVTKKFAKNGRRKRDIDDDDDDFNIDDFVPFMAGTDLAFFETVDDVTMFGKKKNKKAKSCDKLRVRFTDQCNGESNEDSDAIESFHWSVIAASNDAGEHTFRIESRWETCI